MNFTVLINHIKPFVPLFIALSATVFVLLIARLIIKKGYAGKTGYMFSRQVVTFALVILGIIGVLVTLPIRDSLRGQLFTLFGIIISALIALSSTTLIGNSMAGLMLRAVKSFKPGDFIHVNHLSGRVSDKGLFHVEIQTITRDLITIPNQYLINNPVQVTKSDGTFIFAEVSLGYDVPRMKIEEALLEAAKDTELTEAFVHVQALGDFSIVYRIYGLLEDVKYLISAQSTLKKKMLDCLHRADIEIVSPNFMNQRVLNPEQQFIPKMMPGRFKRPAYETEKELADEVVFDKAEEAESLENLREKFQAVKNEIQGSKEFMKNAKTPGQKEIHKQNIELLEQKLNRLEKIIKIKESK